MLKKADGAYTMQKTVYPNKNRRTKMANLEVNIAGVKFHNPVIAASGTFGFGREFSEFYPLSVFGGVSCKGLTLEERAGNPPPRVTETPGGMLNSVGLQNPGADYFIKNDLPWLKKQGTKVIANIAGNTPEGYCSIAEKLSDSPVDMIELNISCPNVKQGGMRFGTTCKSAAEITKEVRKHCTKPLTVKLSPNVSDIGDIAAAVESEGADAISMINTLTGMRIDIRTQRPVLRNNTGGLSGPAVFPVAVRMVWQAYRRVKIPIIGIGGISTWQDAAEIMLAGASAVQIGTVLFRDPYAPVKITNGLSHYLDENGMGSVSELTGKAMPW